jgi:polar amino acid transport system substrate-binding protein
VLDVAGRVGTVAVVGGIRDSVVSDLAPGGVLRAAINLGNPVLAQGPAAAPGGVTVDIANELGARLGVPVELACFAAARESFGALARGDADICFLAIEPARTAEVAFTGPYVVIEGVFLVPGQSAITTLADVDREGVRIGVNDGSAYDLFLSRTLRQASVVRARDGISLFREQGLDAGAGIRQVVSDFVADHPGFRMIDEPFMQIR